MHRIITAALVLGATAACSKSPSGPSSSDPATVLQGQTVSAIDGAAAPSVSVRIGGKVPVTTDTNGLFEVELGGPGTFAATIRGSAIVERETTVVNPSAGRARLSLIPASFDLTAFDEMFRTSNARLVRWTSRPALVVLGSVMEYRTGSGNEYAAGSEQLSDEEVNQMIAHLTEGLALLTGNTFTAFESVQVERPASGTRVNVVRNGHIVVGRFSGIVTWAHTIGYGQWEEQPNGTAIAGAMYLDRDFDKDDVRRRLLRIHELGHALGYLHVTSRTSIMNPSIGPEPTEFDRAASKIAFQRLPGNRSPDIDPTAPGIFSVTTGEAQLRTVYCR